ncbi:MAG TPA: hypothetical protein VL242_32945 [Sorangium sp.]|nr:hypothetical protein [Sorangium sp.]
MNVHVADVNADPPLAAIRQLDHTRAPWRGRSSPGVAGRSV